MNELEALALALEIEKAELRFYIDIPKISKKDKKSVRAKVLRFFLIRSPSFDIGVSL